MKDRMPRPLRPLLATLSLACGLWSGTPALAQPTPPRSAAEGGLDAPLLYQLLIGELELQRGELGTAYQLLLDGARRTGDESLFRRCVSIALQARAGSEAVAAVKAWRLALPASQEARQTQVQLHAALTQWPEMVEPLLAWLEAASTSQQDAALDMLPRLLRAQASEGLNLLGPGLTAVRDDAKAPPLRRSLAASTLAQLAQMAGNTPLAANQLRQALSEAPEHDLPRWQALELMRHQPSVEGLVTDALTRDPALLAAYARALARDHRAAESLAQFERLAVLQPDEAAHRYAVASLQLELRQPQAALEAAVAYLARLAPEDQAGRNAARLLQAQAQEQLGDYAAARASAEAVDDESRQFERSYRLAVLDARQGRVAAARARLRALPGDTPEAAQRRLLAETQLLREINDWPAAHAVLSAALKEEGDEPSLALLYEHAMSAERLGQWDLMEQQLRRVMARDPRHAHAHNALGYSLADRNLRLPEARELIERAIELGGHEPFLVDSLGWLAFREGKLDEAEQLLRQAWRGRPDAEIAAHLGEVLWVRGERDEARRVLDEAWARDRSNAPLRALRQRLGLR